MLIEHFNRKFSIDYGKKLKEFSEAAIDALQNYVWMGNIRELKNTVERIVIMNPETEIIPDDLPIFSNEKPPSSSYRFPSFKEATEAYQREFLAKKLEENEWNISKTAETLGIDRSHLHRRIKNLGIDSKTG